MIKAENITHEGNPGPNWLDHCRDLITPLNLTVTLLVIAVLATVVIDKHHNDGANKLPTTVSQQASYNPAAASSLKVQPAKAATPDSNVSSSTVQAASGASQNSVGPAPTTSAAALGAAATPSLNTTNNPDAAAQPNNNTSGQLGGNLTNNVQTTLGKASDSVQKALHSIKFGL